MKKILLVTVIASFVISEINAQAPAAITTAKEVDGTQTVQPPAPMSPPPAVKNQPQAPAAISTGKEGAGAQTVQPAVPATPPASVAPAPKPKAKVAPASVRKGKKATARQGTHGRKVNHQIKKTDAPSRPLAPEEDNKK